MVRKAGKRKSLEERIEDFRELVIKIAVQTGWTIEYVLELELLTIYDIIAPKDSKGKPKKTKEEHLADLKRLDHNYNKFTHKIRESQRKKK